MPLDPSMFAWRNPHRPGRAPCTPTVPPAEPRLPAAVHGRPGVRGGALGVSPLLPARGTRGSTTPARPWGAGASRPHGPRDSAPRRLPPAPLRDLRWALGPRSLAGFHGAWSPRRARGLGARPDRARAWGRPVPQAGHGLKETGGAPTCPPSPAEALPRSQTPVVAGARAPTHPGRRPSSPWQPSASPDAPPVGAPSRGLSPRSTRLRTAPDGEARGGTTDRRARLSSGRTCPLRRSPTGEQQPVSWSNLHRGAAGFRAEDRHQRHERRRAGVGVPHRRLWARAIARSITRRTNTSSSTNTGRPSTCWNKRCAHLPAAKAAALVRRAMALAVAE